jgi:hypothetical protein
MLRGRWFKITALNAHGPTEEKSDNSKDNLCKELKQVLGHILLVGVS